ncbi:hypothetical protein AB0M29_02655 [Streptomyces sp. NPDC051976]|uniref:hypothetical protein n=1 Tax=Streptomyces sp. NPDC051976 TaxID=3154947 RepID=UPI003419F257
MSVVLGDKQRFAAEVGEREGGLCRVDLWAGGKWLTCDDNMAFVGQFRRDVLDTVDRLRSGYGGPAPFDGLSPEDAHRRLRLRAEGEDETGAEFDLRGRVRILDWGPTTDNVSAHLFHYGDRLVITLQFWRSELLVNHPHHAGEVFVVEIPTAEFIGILEALVATLDEGEPGPG